jgi:hypothetical protein
MLTKRLILVKRFFLHLLDSSWRGEGGGDGDQRTEGREKIADCGINKKTGSPATRLGTGR